MVVVFASILSIPFEQRPSEWPLWDAKIRDRAATEKAVDSNFTLARESGIAVQLSPLAGWNYLR
jgi:hypothetical protein